MREKLIKIQNELNVPKNQRNTFGNYNYRSCEDILEALKPLLKKENLFMTISDELVNIGERYYVKATVKIGDGTKEMEISAYAREEENKKGMDGSQITGASSSYARKYALNGLFLIDDSKDSDATNKHDEPEKTSYSASEKQRNLIYLLYKEKNGQEMPEEEKDKIRKLSSKQASDLITKWKKVELPEKQIDDEIDIEEISWVDTPEAQQND